jgi:predicted negative regulator of RcsB-dependent stress response
VSDYLTDEEQLDKLKTWWQENGVMLLVAVVVAVVGITGWNWYGSQVDTQISQASDLYADYLDAEGAERASIGETLATEFPGSAYHSLMLLRMAEERMTEEDAEGALVLLEDALLQAPDDKLADLVRVRLARIQQELDRSEDALQTLGSVKSMGLRSVVQELKGDIHMVRGERGQAHEAYSAALNEAGEGSQRPLLEMKVADTADTNDA